MARSSGAHSSSDSSPAGSRDLLRDVLALARDHLAADVAVVAWPEGDTWRIVTTDGAASRTLEGASPTLTRTRQAGTAVAYAAEGASLTEETDRPVASRWRDEAEELEKADALRSVGPGLRAYLGQALPGDTPGVLACGRTEARAWTETDAAALRRYARLLKRPPAAPIPEGPEGRANEDRLQLFQTALDQAHEGVIILTAASAPGGGRTIAYVNAAFEAMTGYAAEEVIGASLQLLEGPETDPRPLRRIAAAFETTEAVQEQLLNYRKDGTPFWAEVAIAPVHDAQGRHTYWISIQRDITDRIEAQQALRESEERWRRLVEAHPNPTYITVDGILQYLNPSAVAIFGAASAEELEGRSVFDFAHPEVDALMETRRAKVNAGRPTEPLQHRMQRLDGAERIVVTQSVPVTYKGEPAAQTVLRDVTEQRRAEAALREREKQLSSILDNMPSGVIIVEAPSGTVVRSNEAAEALLGHPIRPGGRERYDQYHALHTDGTPYAADEYPAARALDGATVAQEELVYAGGDSVSHLLVNAAPIRDDDGAIVAAVCTYQDISQLKAVQNALRRSKERFQAVSEQALDVIGVVGADGTFRYLSASFEAVTGLSREAMVGANAFERVHPDDLAEGQAALQEAVRDPDATVEVDLRYRHEDGSWRRLSVRAGQLWTPHDATEVLLNVRDNTEQHRYEELLEERRRRLELALAGGDLGMWDWDMNTDAVRYNERWASMLGYTLDEVEPHLDFFREHVHPYDRNRVFTAVERHAAGEVPRMDLEIRMRAKDGSWRWVLDRGQIVAWNEDGTPRRAVGTHMDITERKAAEAELRRSKTYAERLIGAMQDGFSVVDADGVQVQVNDAFCRMTGFSEDELIGATPPYPYWPEGEQEALGDAFAQTLRDASGDLELTFQRKNGQEFPVLLNPTRLTDGQGQPRYFLATVKDISVRKQYEEGLIEAKREAEAARDRAEEMNRLKSAFLANMSHEIRTPLTSMIGFTEVLEEMELTAPADRFVRLIHRGGERLLNTLNSVLDLSQLEAGAMTIRPVPLRICDEVRDIVEGFGTRADEAGVALAIDVPADPAVIETDRGALQRIVTNIVSNAIKFTDAGGRVTVTVEPAPDQVVLIVADTGVGIGDDFVPHLFEAFQQESTGDAREFEGSGLGMSITKQLVDMMDGSIAVDSVKGEGTTVTVALPNAEAE